MLTHPLFTNYIVLRDGTIMNKKTGKVMKSSPDKEGYERVSLRKDKKAHRKGVHRLILQTYNPIENDHLYHAHHIDGVRHHNHIGNLRWELPGEHLREHKSFISDETRKRMSESQKGRVVSEESRRKIGEAHKGKVVSEETRRKLSESLKGIKRSEEHRRKIGEAQKGRVFSDETKKKISESKMGKVITEETRRKISDHYRGMLYWNNGVKNIRSKTHPGNGWVRGRM